jgi:predicted ATPase
MDNIKYIQALLLYYENLYSYIKRHNKKFSNCRRKELWNNLDDLKAQIISLMQQI